ncbi:MAG: helix-turn-helix transcriptional regulator [Acholeplasmataceae bacterium]|nr:helix-turn-helix transcriptional regulator [Acholeplasmataceae bacterium]
MIGERLKDLRIRENLTQKEVADIINVTPQTISKWELGTSEPGIDMLIALSGLYHVSVDEILKDSLKTHTQKIQEQHHIKIGLIVMYVLLLAIAITINFVPYLTADISVFELGMIDSWLDIQRPLIPVTLELKSWFFLVLTFSLPLILATLYLVEKKWLGSIVVTFIGLTLLLGQQLSMLASPLFISPNIGIILHLVYNVILIAILILLITIKNWKISQHIEAHPKTWIAFVAMVILVCIMPFSFIGGGQFYYFTIVEYVLFVVMMFIACMMLLKDIKKIQIPLFAISSFFMLILSAFAGIYFFNTGLYFASIIIFSYMVFLALSMSEIKDVKLPLNRVFLYVKLLFEVLILGTYLYLYISAGDLFSNLHGGYVEIMIWDLPQPYIPMIGMVVFAVAMILRYIKIHKVARYLYFVWYISHIYYSVLIYINYPSYDYFYTDGILLFIPTIVGAIYLFFWFIKILIEKRLFKLEQIPA